MSKSGRGPEEADPGTPSPARIYNYMLGGEYHFPADRAAAERLREQMPDLQEAALANRAFHGRVASWLAERGIRQFIDLGSGLPVPGSTHQLVHKVAPQARVAYVDIDPMITALAHKLRADDGSTVVIEADLCDTDDVLGDPGLRALIDLSEPAGLLMTSVLQFIGDGADPWAAVARYMAALAPGSYLALSHVTGDNLPGRVVLRGIEVYQKATQNAFPRSHAEVMRFFDGLEIVPPWPGAGPVLTNPSRWGTTGGDGTASDGSRAFYCAVARRP